ncbi:MAG: conjugal transfer protein TraF [Rickettsiaceae bacterium]|nr:conjugal transfer protein TraF [Rickettsiaceae bacterium]
MRTRSYLLILISILSSPLCVFADIGNNSSFFDQRYKGWMWFEEKQVPKKHKAQNKNSEQLTAAQTITPEEARIENSRLKKKLDDLREVMIARPTSDNILKYMLLEEQMWGRALKLDDNVREVKFLYPEIFSKLKEPENVHAVKLKRKIEEESNQSIIKEFAKRYNLVFFSKGNCPYCANFAPLLKSFSTIYGFKTEEASSDGHLSNYFPGKKLPDLARSLNINSFPAVVIVAKEGNMAMELIRGYVTISELEEYVLLADQYLKKIRPPQNKTLSRSSLTKITGGADYE